MKKGRSTGRRTITPTKRKGKPMTDWNANQVEAFLDTMNRMKQNQYELMSECASHLKDIASELYNINETLQKKGKANEQV